MGIQYFQQNFFKPLPIEPNSINLCIMSPPLLVFKKTKEIFGILNRYMDDTGWICIDAPAGYTPYDILLYEGVCFSLWTKYCHHFVKDCYTLGKDQCIHVYYKRGTRGHVCGVNRSISVNPNRQKRHSCEFCPDLIRTLIDMYCEPGDTVLDGFCGTGTVMKVAEQMGRKGIGVDLRPMENLYVN